MATRTTRPVPICSSSRSCQFRSCAATALVVVLLSLAYGGTARAADIPVGPTCTLPDAITAANTDVSMGGCPAGSGVDTVILEAGALYMLDTANNEFGEIGDNGLPPITSTITISGNGASILRTSGAPRFRLLFVGADGDLSLEEVTIGGGNAEAGGGVLNVSGSLKLSGSRVVSNTATQGGGIHSSGTDASLTLSNGSMVAGNHADYGGGIFNAASAVVEDSVLASNTADESGGGIYNGSYDNGSPNASLTMGGTSLVVDNHAGYGGGVYNASDVTLEGTRILSNTVSNSGGGIFNAGPTGLLTITEQSLISGNAATIRPGKNSFGGGLSNFQATTIITDSIISANTAEYGGGLDNFRGVLMITNSSLISNTADLVGGGVYNIGTDAAATLYGVHLLYNEASATGGALYHDGGTAGSRLRQSCVVFNSSSAVQVGTNGTVDASNNWWGHASGPSGAGPGIGDAVGANVAFAEFLTDAPFLCPTTSPEMHIKKSVTPTVVMPGGTITYTLSVSNSGPAVATQVTITDLLPFPVTVTGIQQTAIGAGVTITPVTNPPLLGWQLSKLSIGHGAVITITGIVGDNRNLIGSTVSNTASVAVIGDMNPSGSSSSTAEFFIAPPPGAYLPTIER